MRKTRKKQHPRLSRLLAVLGLILGMIGLTPLLPASPVHAEPTESVEIGMPFTGLWAYNVQTTAACGSGSGQTSHPSCHENYYGNWGTDLYAADGTNVYLQLGNATGTVSYSFVSVSDGSCGHRVVVQVSVGSIDVGSVYFDHLKNEANSTSDITDNGGKVGQVDQTCHTGYAHTHLELKNPSGYACYLNKSTSSYTTGISVSNGVAIGKLGQTGATGNKQECTGSGGGATGVGTKLMGNVDGDAQHKADAVVMFKDTGTAMVALAQSNSTFSSPGAWSYGHSNNASRYMLGDVNGDGKDDLVAYFAADGRWKVSTSTGTGFTSPIEWGYGEGSNTTKQFVADVNGDGKADAITFNSSNGDWMVFTSTGSGFNGATAPWLNGSGIGSSDQVVADFNNDQIADVAVYFSSTGNWKVSLSTGSSFGYPGDWSWGHGLGSNLRRVGDFNADHKADIAYYSSANRKWYISINAGGGLWAEAEWSYDGAFPDPYEAFMADVDGDGRTDKVLYYNADGAWYVANTSWSGGFWSPNLALLGHGANS